jgi:hypothetical protein
MPDIELPPVPDNGQAPPSLEPWLIVALLAFFARHSDFRIAARVDGPGARPDRPQRGGALFREPRDAVSIPSLAGTHSGRRKMSLTILEHGDGRFHFFHGDHEVGWLEGRTIAFVNFDKAGTARLAAEVAYDALTVWLARQRITDPPARRGRPIRTRYDGGGLVLTLFGRPIGRLSEPESMGGAHGFELRLPPQLVSTLVAAQVIDLALSQHPELGGREPAVVLEGSEFYV